MLEGALVDVDTYFHSLEVQPTLTAIRNKVESIAREEMEKVATKRLKHLSDEEKAQMQHALTSTVAKVLHPTMMALKYGAQQRGASGLVAAARLLYGLDPVPGDSTEAADSVGGAESSSNQEEEVE